MNRWIPAAAIGGALVAGAVFAVVPVTAQTAGTISACINSSHQLTHVTTGTPLACAGQTPVSWPGNVPGSPSPAPSPTLASPSPSPTTASPSPSPTSTGAACVTSAAQGSCGPYDSYPGITGYNTGNTTVGNNVWNQIPGWHETLAANSPGDWSVTANMPAGNTAVVSYPDAGVNIGHDGNPYSYLLSQLTSVTSSFTEQMPGQADTFAEAAYDIWGGDSTCATCTWDNEVMIQVDFGAAGPGRCGSPAATFGGQQWNLCVFGSELIWQLPAGVSESSGSVDILAMLQWLNAHGYLEPNYGLTAVGFGFEINSTGGHDETFGVSSYTFDAH